MGGGGVFPWLSLPARRSPGPWPSLVHAAAADASGVDHHHALAGAYGGGAERPGTPTGRRAGHFGHAASQAQVGRKSGHHGGTLPGQRGAGYASGMPSQVTRNHVNHSVNTSPTASTAPR